MIFQPDSPAWESHLPINPPGSYFNEGFDVMMTEVDIINWESEGGPIFIPRLRDSVQTESDGMGAAGEDDAPELDMEYDCE